MHCRIFKFVEFILPRRQWSLYPLQSILQRKNCRYCKNYPGNFKLHCCSSFWNYFKSSINDEPIATCFTVILIIAIVSRVSVSGHLNITDLAHVDAYLGHKLCIEAVTLTLYINAVCIGASPPTLKVDK